MKVFCKTYLLRSTELYLRWYQSSTCQVLGHQFSRNGFDILYTSCLLFLYELTLLLMQRYNTRMLNQLCSFFFIWGRGICKGRGMKRPIQSRSFLHWLSHYARFWEFLILYVQQYQSLSINSNHNQPYQKYIIKQMLRSRIMLPMHFLTYTAQVKYFQNSDLF